jgi:hypothetical protein
MTLEELQKRMSLVRKQPKNKQGLTYATEYFAPKDWSTDPKFHEFEDGIMSATYEYADQNDVKGPTTYTVENTYGPNSTYPTMSIESGTRNGVDAFIVHKYDKNGNISQMNDTLFNGVDKNDPRYQ